MHTMRMKTIHALLFASVLLAGCVTSDTWGIHEKGHLPVGELKDETRQQLKSAAAGGETELISVAGRLAWADPEQAVSIANYSANLFPDRSAEIAAAVAQAVAR